MSFDRDQLDTANQPPKQKTRSTRQYAEPYHVSDVSLEIDRQVAYYHSKLALEAQKRSRTATKQAEMSRRYTARSKRVQAVDGHPVNIFAPFVKARSALQTFTPGQRLFVAVMMAIFVGGLIVSINAVLVLVLAIIMAFYFGNLLITFWLSVRTLNARDDINIPDEVIHQLAGADWPHYTILCPLYRETEVVEQFASAMAALDYPTDKLQILFLTEADDEETRDAIRAARLPSHFEIITVPDGHPRTKPRACNYGLLYATGDFLVIYDAEDVPDPLQLKKAVLAFVSNDENLGCVQAKLNFYNSHQNILTRFFTIEYSTWFEMTLPGLQLGDFSIPLGGTSNHFRVNTLRKIGAWDAFNVTEDCDLGLRLSTNNLRTVILDSTTLEEANPHVRNWIRQRSRWIKGYFQTYLVHMRDPQRFVRPLRLREFLSLQLIVGGRTLVLLINPIMWVMLLIYIVFRATVTDYYEILFPAPILYTAVISIIAGNLLQIYIHFTGCLKREQYDLVKWTLFIPFYWALGSYAAFKALVQLITKPHHWEKTNHGLHLNQAVVKDTLSKPLHNEINQQEAFAHERHDTTAVVHSANKLVNGANNHALRDAPAIPQAATNGRGNGHKRPDVFIAVEPDYISRRVHRSRFDSLRNLLPKDPWLRMTIAAAAIASVLATLHFFQANQITLYLDAFAHLAIARRTLDNVTPGFAQLGGIWLPLPHLLMLPFILSDYLWQTGLAGTFVSMPCYVLTAVFIFLAARQFTGNSAASFVGSLVFILNPNVLYLQSTPLTEPLAALTTTATGYYFLVWIKDDRPLNLFLLAGWMFLGTLTRYDGWALFMGVFVLIPFVSFLKHRKRYRAESDTIVFALLGGAGIGIWLLWCAMIFDDPLYFQRSIYSAQAQQQGFIANDELFTYHNAWEAIRYFMGLSVVTVGPGLFVLSIAGLSLFLLRWRFSILSLAAMVFLIPFGFYIFSLYTGQIIIYLPGLVPEGTPIPYFNTRYGMVAVPIIALFVAILAAELSRIGREWFQSYQTSRKITYQVLVSIVLSIFMVFQTLITTQSGVVALQDGQFGISCFPRLNIGDFLIRYYDGGKVLADTYVSGSGWGIATEAGINLRDFIYEGSGSFWWEALADPASHVEWIILNPYDSSDAVNQAIDETSVSFRLSFSPVSSNPNGRTLYRRNDLPSLVERPIPSYLVPNLQCDRPE